MTTPTGQQHPDEDAIVHVAKTLIQRFDERHRWTGGRLTYHVHMREVADVAVAALREYEDSQVLAPRTG